MNTKAFRVSWIMQLVVLSITILSGLIMVFAAEFFLAGEFEGFTGQQWADFAESNPKATAFFLLEGTQMGLFMITLGTVLLVVNLFAYRKGQKWAWYLFLFSVTVGIGGPVVTNIPTKDIGVISMVVILFLAGYVALALGAKPILRKPPDTTG
jgi:hypothetical protein